MFPSLPMIPYDTVTRLDRPRSCRFHGELPGLREDGISESPYCQCLNTSLMSLQGSNNGRVRAMEESRAEQDKRLAAECDSDDYRS